MQAVVNLLKRLPVGEERPIIIGIPEKDIFFTLDDDAIRKAFANEPSAAGKQAYPGHEAFWKAFGASTENYKQFRERRYGIPMNSIDWYEPIVEQMHGDETLAPSLVAALDELELRLLSSP